MRIWFPAPSAALLALFLTTPAVAQDPTGDWQVEDGSAHIRIVDCGGVLWGVVSWEKTPGRDIHNPDPVQRGRPTLGMPVLLHMTPSEPGRWEGDVYNAKNGRSYDASIELKGADALHVEGCALEVLCGGEDWTRLAQTEPAQPQRGRGAATTGALTAPASAPSADICAAIAGRPH